MGIFSLKPARQSHVDESSVQVVADLDRLIAEPVGFRLRGKLHIIKPITTRQFLVITSKLGMLDTFQQKLKAGITFKEEDLVHAYHEIFNSCSDTISKEDLMEMTHAQRAALLQIVLDCLGGKAHLEAEKKKPLMPETKTTQG